jgi:hypothetical protein
MPHAAATSGSSNAGASLSTASEASVVSASTAITQSVSTHPSAKVCAPAFEPVFTGGHRTVAPAARATCAVPSVEQSSTTTISAGVRV